MDWQKNILHRDAEIADLLKNTKRIAVLGIKTEAQSFQPAFYVPQYMQRADSKSFPCRYITRKRPRFWARKFTENWLTFQAN
jgi:predicted CoA-binding protein